jgi:hypothetical protein
MGNFIQNVYAQNTGDQGICNPLIKGLCGGPDTATIKFASFFSALVGVFLIIASLFTFVNLLQGGLSWITSGGDKTALEAARSRIQNAILGLFIVAASWVIFILIMQFLGISPLGTSNFQFNFPSLFGQ